MDNEKIKNRKTIFGLNNNSTVDMLKEKCMSNVGRGTVSAVRLSATLIPNKNINFTKKKNMNYQQRIFEILKNESPDSSNDLNSFKKQIEKIINEIFNIAIEEKKLIEKKIRKTHDNIEITNENIGQLRISINDMIESFFINGINKGFIKGYIDTLTTAKAVNSMIISAVNDFIDHKSPYKIKQKWVNTIIVFVFGSLA